MLCDVRIEETDNKLFKAFFAVRNNSLVLNCSISQLEERKRETKGEKRGNWESIQYGSCSYPTPHPFSFPGNIPSSSTSDSMSLTSSLVAIIPRFFMTSSSSSVVMVWLLSTSKILNASLNSRMISQQALVGFV